MAPPFTNCYAVIIPRIKTMSIGSEKKMEIIMPSLAERLKPLRKSKNMTQKAMAELLDCTERHYQKIEYGQINVPATTVIFLADYFGVTADYLLGRE